MSSSIINIENLSKKYDRQQVLNHINCNIRKGEICTIIGSSGCGKSTFLQILGLLDNDFSGRVLIDNNNIQNINNEKKRKIRKYAIGFVYQFHFLIPELTIAQNIALSLSLQKTSKKLIQEKVHYLLKKINLADKEKKFPHTLSGGERQRVAIARAIAHDPKIIIADEPTGNLDPQNTENIFQILYDIAKNNKTTVILATHNMQIAQKCDQIIDLSHQFDPQG